jgi:hypothetical protein
MQRGNGNTSRRRAVTLESERQAIRELVDLDEGVEHQIGVHYNVIVDGRLWKQGGYKNAPDFFRREVKELSTSVLALYGAVARHFSEDIAQEYGMSNLGALLSYAANARLDLPPGDPGSVSIQVPGKDGKVTVKRFADCSRAEIQAAIRRVRGHDEGGTGRIPKEDAREVVHLRQTLRNAVGLGSPADLKAIFRNGQTMLSMENVPLSAFTSVCQALGWPAQRPLKARAPRPGRRAKSYR